MSCYHPLFSVKTGNKTENGKDEWKVISKFTPDLQENFGKDDSAVVPCGKCLGCRLDYSRIWANRMMFELDHCDHKAVFVTLTYDDAHVPAVFNDDGSIHALTLNKKDFQDFLKRLRGRKKFDGREIRFYLGAEYGSTTFRPHGHAILFNVGLEDFSDLVPFGKNELGDVYYKSDEFTSIWQNGFTLLSEVSWKTCAYVSRYVTKKVMNGNGMVYEMLGVEPEFSLMSRRPGLGSKYFEDHPEKKDLDAFYFNDGSKSVKLPVTKNLLSQLEKSDPDRYNQLKERNKSFASDAVLLELMKSDLGLTEYLERKESVHLAKTASLLRNKL